jgi:hypothetical protein
MLFCWKERDSRYILSCDIVLDTLGTLKLRYVDRREIMSFEFQVFLQNISDTSIMPIQWKPKQLIKVISWWMKVLLSYLPGNEQQKNYWTVGALQYEVIQYRLEHEYGANVRMKTFLYIKLVGKTNDLKVMNLKNLEE